MRKYLPRPQAKNSKTFPGFMAHVLAYYFWGPVVAALVVVGVVVSHRPTWLAVLLAVVIVPVWFYVDYLLDPIAARKALQLLDVSVRDLARDVRRNWVGTMISSGFQAGEDKRGNPIVPLLFGAESVGRGLALTVEFIAGHQHAGMFAANADRLASAFNVGLVEVTIVDPRVVRLLLVTRDPLENNIAPSIEGFDFDV